MSDTPRYMCVVPGCPGEHASKYLCCDFPEHQPGKWVGPLTVNTRGINIGICDATNYRIAWSHFPEYAEALATICNSFDALTEANKQLREALTEARANLRHATHCRSNQPMVPPQGFNRYPCDCGIDHVREVATATLKSTGAK